MIAEALSKKKCKYKLIVLDYDMPRMKGIACAERIRAEYTRAGIKAPHIAILSSYYNESLK